MENTQPTAPFPLPPEYAKNYTNENIRNGMFLPPPPVPTKHIAFNEEFNQESSLIPSLSDVGIQQMYSSTVSWKLELKKLNRSVIAAFLDLLSILTQCPDHSERLEKLETIRLLFINMHHLINEYRPVQARDTLRQMIVRQNKEIKDVNDKLEDYVNASEKTISTYRSLLQNLQLDNNECTISSNSKITSTNN